MTWYASHNVCINVFLCIYIGSKDLSGWHAKWKVHITLENAIKVMVVDRLSRD